MVFWKSMLEEKTDIVNLNPDVLKTHLYAHSKTWKIHLLEYDIKELPFWCNNISLFCIKFVSRWGQTQSIKILQNVVLFKNLNCFYGSIEILLIVELLFIKTVNSMSESHFSHHIPPCLSFTILCITIITFLTNFTALKQP